MAYDAATVAVLRNVLDEILTDDAFTQQNHRSAVEVAERVLWLASQGERDSAAIKRHVLNVLLTRAAA
jgi:hypothetical protein